MATSKTLKLSPGESGTVTLNTDNPGVLSIIVDPGGDRGEANINPPVSEYRMNVEALRNGSFTEVAGSPLFSTDIGKTEYLLGEKGKQVQITITNRGSSTGYVDITGGVINDNDAIVSLSDAERIKPYEAQMEEIITKPGAVNEKGNFFLDVQDAIDDADSWVAIGPAEFNEAITFNKPDIHIIGSGEEQTIIDGGDQPAFHLNDDAARGRIRQLEARCNVGSSSSAILLSTPSEFKLLDLNIPEAGVEGVNQQTSTELNDLTTVARCTFGEVSGSTTIGSRAIRFNGRESLAANNMINQSVASNAIFLAAENTVAIGNIIDNTQKHGIVFSARQSLAVGNVMRLVENNGLNWVDDEGHARGNLINNAGGSSWDVSGAVDSSVVGCISVSPGSANSLAADTVTAGNVEI